jgi:hypothetical protein
MKLQKKLVCATISAAMLASSAVAFAAPDYDTTMEKAQTLFSQGLYYETEAELLTLINSGVNWSAAQSTEIQKWYNATRFQIEVLENPSNDKWQKLEGFQKVAEYLNDGLYYEADELLVTIKNVYSLSSVEEQKWNQYKALAEAGIQWWEDVCNEGITADGAIALVKAELVANGIVDPADTDIAYTVTKVYSTADLKDGYQVEVYSKLAYNEGRTGTLAIYLVQNQDIIQIF